jgi:adenylate cyclase
MINSLKAHALKSEYLWKTKIGIHNGKVVGGVVGIKKYIYDIFGTTVNLASRLQAATKLYNVDILISGETYHQIADLSAFHIRKIDIVRVKGEEHPIELYEVFDCDNEHLKECKRVTLPKFEEARTEYINGNFEAALLLFKECNSFCAEDEIVSIYIKRCSTMKRMPKRDDWSGVNGI